MAHETIQVGLFVIFGIIMLPVYVMIAGWLLGKPRDYRSVALTFGYGIAFMVALVVAIGVLGTILSLIVPY